MQAPEQQQLITQEQVITPLVGILNEAVPTHKPTEVSPPVKQSLDELFPEQKIEDKNVQRAKEILGDIANELTPAQLKDTIVEIQYLVNTWLDDFEREIFEGKTLQELLHEKGGQ